MREFNDIDLKKEAKQEYEELPLTLQIMHELKLSSQRWFLIAVFELIVILAMIVFIFVIPAEEVSSYSQDVSDVYDTQTVSQTIGE
jgi:hypothetical protein